MGDYETGVIHDKAVALAVQGKLFHQGLDAFKLYIQRNDILTVRQHPADGNDEIPGLGIHIGRNKCHIPVVFLCNDIPVTGFRVVALRRFPV